VRERIEYRFRVLSATVFTLYSYSKALEYRFRVPTTGSLSYGFPRGGVFIIFSLLKKCSPHLNFVSKILDHLTSQYMHLLFLNVFFSFPYISFSFPSTHLCARSLRWKVLFTDLLSEKNIVPTEKTS
jgi:cellulose synthase/poly-beta-1,6-N-acetylglucosamine synthase-like glycosyltransferase